eukprot:TRINITY_DN4275_c0_g1_i1.p1 TRINITY_DN4275_c0_g1~~TRINITY_DN4275_c0_g1_i1.p1  ORF type:complete len:885 (-),score=188.90 TRINITY_DN4275_c0_g1_i1:1621-4275(-)
MTMKEALFGPYRPFCAALASTPSPNVLHKLKELIESEKNDATLQILLEYLIFPHQVYLRNPSRPENYTIETLNILRGILSRATVDSSFLFKDLLSILMKLDCKSEDAKLALANLLGELFRSASSAVIPFEEESHRYELSHVVFSLLNYLESASENTLLRGTLCSLNIIIDVYKDKKLIQPMIPGLLSKLIKVLKDKKGAMKSKALSECIQLWTRVFSEIFLLDSRAEDIKSLNHVSSHLNEILPYSYSEHAYVQSAATQVFYRIKSIDYYLKETIELAASILSKGNTEEEVMDFITEENHSRVQSIVFGEIHTMTEVFEDVEVHRLLGFICLLHNLKKSYQFFKSESYQKPFLNTLLRLSRIECKRKIQQAYVYVKSETLVFEYSLKDLDSLFMKSKDNSLGDKEYVYLKHDDEVHVFKRICEVLSGGPADVLGNALPQILQGSEDQRKKDALSLIPLIVHSGMNDWFFEELLDNLLQCEEKYEDEICECLIRLISCSPGDMRANYMSDVLSYILTKTVNRNIISYALNTFSELEDFSEIRDFLASYSRPLSQTLFIRLRNLHAQDVPLILLSIVLQLESNTDELRDVFSILLSQLDISWLSSDKSLTSKILQIIKTSVESLVVPTNEESVLKSTLELKKHSNNEIGALTELVKGLLKDDKEAFLDDETVDEEAPVNEEEEEGERQLSCEQSYLQKCILHTRHFVSMVRCPRWQILSMEIIVLCIRISVLPDDELLPLVHQIWQPLKLLFESNNIFVVDRAFSLLNTLALSAKDFIRRRSEQDVFPHILKYLSHLKSLMLNSSKEGSSSLLIARQAEKLLSKMHKCLWSFTALLDLDEKSVGHLASSLGSIEAEENKAEASSLYPLRECDEDILYYYYTLKGKI